jgi:hypothetical protein
MSIIFRSAALAASIVASLWISTPPLLAHSTPEIKPPSLIRVPIRHLESWIAEGLARSATLRGLVERLDRAHVIVYFGVNPLGAGMLGRTQIMGAGGGFRYLHIDVDDRGQRIPVLSIVGHELQHAAEIADDPSVVDEPTLAALYERIGTEKGFRQNRTRWFETDAAIEAGRRVYSELVTASW